MAKIKRLACRAKSSNGQIVVVSADPTHPTHNTLARALWQEQGRANTITLGSTTGRERLTIVGALNIVDQQPTILTTKENCDRNLIKVFVDELRKQYCKAETIIVIVDNASYQKSKDIRRYAKERGVVFEYLPPYAPNLSLVERIWKFMKKKVLTNIYYEKFELFEKAINTFFANWDSYANELQSLLTLNFEIIKP